MTIFSTNRRRFLSGIGGGITAALFNRSASAQPTLLNRSLSLKDPVSVNVLGIPSLPFEWEGKVKVFRLTAEPVTAYFQDMSDVHGGKRRPINTWGYNASMIGPTIEATEGDIVRLHVTNHLPDPTTIHWHGIELPNAMDGVSGATQDPIMPGETFIYEFPLIQSGTYFYHPHFMSAKQVGMGCTGFFIIHPKNPEPEYFVDKDFAVMLQVWMIDPDSTVPNILEMSNFNYFTMNGKPGPDIPEMNVARGEKVRIRIANMSMLSHPIHLHGFSPYITEMGAGFLPKHQWMKANTINVSSAEVRTMEFDAIYPGKWMFHCHFLHHTMNDMDRRPFPGQGPSHAGHEMGGMSTLLNVK